VRVFAYSSRSSSSLLKLIGNTPLIKLGKISEIAKNNVFVKLELSNPSGSIKDRVVMKIIEAGEKKNILKKNSLIVEATTGNTGISLAMIAKIKGYKAILFVPQNISKEKIEMMRAFGAKVVKVKGKMKNVVENAKKFLEKNKAFFLNQFENYENVLAHMKTGKEIFEQMNGKIDAFVAGVGTGGTLIGIAKVLKEKIPEIKIIAVEPKEMPALYSRFYGKNMRIKKAHMIEGIGEGFVPKILEENLSLIDDVVLVSSKEAIRMTKFLAKSESIFAGISSGANVFAVLQVSKILGGNKNIVTVLPDRGERYFSKNIFK
jgi:cysteine synthase A